MHQDISPDWELIQKLGGPAAVARELNLPAKSGVQTVHNWKTRGIPAGVKLQRPDLFLPNLTKRKGSVQQQQQPQPTKKRKSRASASDDAICIDMEPSGK